MGTARVAEPLCQTVSAEAVARAVVNLGSSERTSGIEQASELLDLLDRRAQGRIIQ